MCFPDRREKIVREKFKNRPTAVSRRRWQGIAAVGTRVFCAPSDSNYVLILDTESEELSRIRVWSISAGEAKWRGMVALGTKLYGAPCAAVSAYQFQRFSVLVFALCTLALGGTTRTKSSSWTRRRTPRPAWP